MPRGVQVSREAHSCSWLWGQSVKETAEWKKPRGGADLGGGHRQAGGTSSSKDLDQGLCRFLCVTDAFGNLMASVDLLLETKTYV